MSLSIFSEQDEKEGRGGVIVSRDIEIARARRLETREILTVVNTFCWVIEKDGGNRCVEKQYEDKRTCSWTRISCV